MTDKKLPTLLLFFTNFTGKDKVIDTLVRLKNNLIFFVIHNYFQNIWIIKLVFYIETL